MRNCGEFQNGNPSANPEFNVLRMSPKLMHRLKLGNLSKEEMGKLRNQQRSLKALKATKVANKKPGYEKSYRANLVLFECNEKSNQS